MKRVKLAEPRATETDEQQITAKRRRALPAGESLRYLARQRRDCVAR